MLSAIILGEEKKKGGREREGDKEWEVIFKYFQTSGEVLYQNILIIFNIYIDEYW